MPLDLEFMNRHATTMHDGVEERAGYMEVGGQRCFVMSYIPAAPKEIGFVVCHSYGLEFLTFRRMERALAQSLARMGYPVLSYHGRGYGDSAGALEEATLDAHLQDVRSAWEQLAVATDVRRMGLIGARFGGFVAGLAARDQDIDRLLLINPALNGSTYFRQMIREMHLALLADPDGEARRSMQEVLEDLRTTGVIDVLGYPVHRRLFDAARTVDLSSDIGRFRGDALVIHVTRRQSPPRDMGAFQQTVDAAGGRCRLAWVQEPSGVSFGGPAFVSTSDPAARVDMQEPIVEEIALRAKEWMSA